MRLVPRLAAGALVWALGAATLAGQDRALAISVYGGGADHLADLRSSPPAWFMPGYNLGASVGVQLNQYFAVHGDFTFTRNPTHGVPTFAGNDVNRFFYGAHVEARYPFANGLAPFLFAGGGAVSVDQLGIDRFAPFTRPAAMYGAGLFYAIPRTHVEVFGELKGLTYRWNTAGFDRMMFDVTYSGGLSYRLPF
ncbi:MAG TPA: outer membrane beta-barrel protein [Gemmatimonadales bacterium]|nr:outer membrane beta-barrel protein [Gemmatimonadales bacterium]